MSELQNTVLLFCSVCEKCQYDVRYLIVGYQMNICNECVGWCNQLIEERMIEELTQLSPVNDDDY